LGEMRYGLLNDIRKLDKSKLPRTVDRFVALADTNTPPATVIPNPRLIYSHDNALRILNQQHLTAPSEKILGLCPGAEYGEAKRWPAEHYAQVAKAALDKGWAVWLFGSDKDIQVTSDINEMTQSRCINWAGKTSLADAIDLMALCDSIISNDSGLMHVAAALDKKLIAIYGSSDPHHTPPMHPNAVIEYLALECSPCFKRQCPLGHLNCLKNISPAAVSRKALHN